ncbi:uncharacterized protein N7479_001570 [Penicillium vulpinum]|uniref:Altered inheritance of mitochondria protein 9, mitochondrial n=1 Tax=Penicillium vulpinum TaxID=29845 RepID=A0A1V6RVK4_9EURO|nr:uncharacterized protein N7479_001570 [Penicillium vulpinum]KAJ5971652.1 hypothetical protein N7479_001570 [Penicillium vulpinum]OQE05529.1 hypothetical protein PENVUL_c024G03984 [Penicillium vulpinum]
MLPVHLEIVTAIRISPSHRHELFPARLARVAVDSVGAVQCISIKKYPDGMFNKTFLMTMEDGREVIDKVPNPIAGVPHFTTASEVATMDFARKVLDTPVPRVYAWNSRAKSHPVGAEFIIMDKIEGVPLSQVWSMLQLPQRLKVILAMTSLQKKWLSVSFSHYGSLYYAGDVQSFSSNHYVKDGIAVKSSEFAIGPATETKVAALACYQKIVDALISKDTSVTNPYLCHNDLHYHDDNIFVDSDNPERITVIIDWQSCHISPLFNYNPDSALLDWDGLEPETLDLAPRPTLSGLPSEEISAAMRDYIVQNMFIGWRKLMHAKNPDLYRAIEFRKTSAYGLILLAHRMFEYGEAHFLSLLVDPGITGDIPFPFEFSEMDIERIKLDSDDAVAGTELLFEIKETMGDLWPDKGFIEHERYDECKAALDEIKAQILEQLAETDEEKAEYQRYWPFE